MPSGSAELMKQRYYNNVIKQHFNGGQRGKEAGMGSYINSAIASVRDSEGLAGTRTTKAPWGAPAPSQTHEQRTRYRHPSVTTRVLRARQTDPSRCTSLHIPGIPGPDVQNARALQINANTFP